MTNKNKKKSKPATVSAKPKRVKSFQDNEIDRMLVSGEEVILRAMLHNAIYWKSVAVLLFALFVWLFIAAPLGVLFFVVGGIMLLLAVITQHFLLLAVTNKRVLARYGLLQMDVVDIRLSKIESIDLERMLPGHIFGYASVVVMGTGQRLIRVPYIKNAESFRRYYNEMVLADEGNLEAEEEIKEQKEAIERQNKKSSTKGKAK